MIMSIGGQIVGVSYSWAWQIFRPWYNNVDWTQVVAVWKIKDKNIKVLK